MQLPQEYVDQIDSHNGGCVTYDWAFCRFLTKEIGVTAIPLSPFYSPASQHLAKNYVRFAFCKSSDLIEEASRRLLRLKAFAK